MYHSSGTWFPGSLLYGLENERLWGRGNCCDTLLKPLIATIQSNNKVISILFVFFIIIIFFIFKWCIRGQCVKKRRPKQMDGHWGQWGEYKHVHPQMRRRNKFSPSGNATIQCKQRFPVVSSVVSQFFLRNFRHEVRCLNR